MNPLRVRAGRAAVGLMLALAATTAFLSGCSSSGGAKVELVAPPVLYVSRDTDRPVSDLRVQEKAVGVTGGLRITFDATGLKDVVGVERALDNCPVHLPVYHCDTHPETTGSGGIQSFHLSPAKGAKAGDSGVLRYRVTAPGLAPVTGHSLVVVGRPELRVTFGPDPAPVAAGGSVAVGLTVHNVGDVPARGVSLTMQARDGVTFRDRHRNCRYRGDTVAWCRLPAADIVIPPGRSYGLETREHLRAARDATYPTVDVTAAAVGDDYVPPAAIASRYGKGDGPALHLLPVPRPASDATDRADDGRRTLRVAVRNRSELAAVSDTARGPVGSLASVRIGVRNNGPGALPADAKVVFTVPDGTTVAASPYRFENDEEVIDQDCRAVTDDGTPLAEASERQPSARRYVCTARVGAVGTTTTFPFTLRIDRAGSHDGGRVTVSDADPDHPSRDTRPADDAADVQVSVWPGPPWATPRFDITAAVALPLLTLAATLYVRRRRSPRATRA
ncbi:hypothetical protein [Streptomyces aureus]|uniref:hypothetical protein n=1 Tax=Streptomyces aureus TaxID=193461 RepID=UPI003410D54F